MGKVENPFLLKGYAGPGYFCDRQEETTLLERHMRHGQDVTLLSIRRMGKTGLIHHLFYRLRRKKEFTCIYVDLYASQSLQELVNLLAGAILQVFPEKQSLGKKFLNLLKGFNPVISYDMLTGAPEVSLTFNRPQQQEYSLRDLLFFLNEQPKPVVVALDEFQQIVSYPEKNVEALLRTLIQPLGNLRFIFSGSRRHVLQQMFSSARRPFFASTSPLHLGPIPDKAYSTFIKKMFSKHERQISDEAVEFVLDWTCRHTYYTQAVCNRLFSLPLSEIKLADVRQACYGLLLEYEDTYLQYRNLLTKGQWRLLWAIASEHTVTQPTAGSFLRQYGLGSPASVKRSLQALEEKEMLYREVTADTTGYRLTDCFLARWLEHIRMPV